MKSIIKAKLNKESVKVEINSTFDNAILCMSAIIDDLSDSCNITTDEVLFHLSAGVEAFETAKGKAHKQVLDNLFEGFER